MQVLDAFSTEISFYLEIVFVFITALSLVV